jgi:dihydrofolate synthase / folylpolyglutamate synthase
MNAGTQTIIKSPKGGLGKVKNYSQVVSLLDSLRPFDYDEKVIGRMKELDKLLGTLSTKMDIVLVGGTNGKSLSIHFATKLLKEEGFNVGAAYSSHFLNYNERTAINYEQINNKDFTDNVNDVLDVAINNKIDSTSFEILTMASLLYFSKQNIDVALLEVGVGGKFDATNFCNPKISAISRVAQDNTSLLGEDLDEITNEMLEITRPGAWFISAEQSKLRLQKMKSWIESRGVKWSMPIRKLANLPYLYEQLYGRTASLGERIAQIYVEEVKDKFSPLLKGNILATKEGQRGRPTIEAKRQAELNPLKSLKTFWAEQFNLLKGRFELLDKEKPSILLDCAHNLDAFENLFLGIRLMHYQKPLKGLALVVGISKDINKIEAIKAIRYLTRKVSGDVLFVPLTDKDFHGVVELEAAAKEAGLKAKGFNSFDAAFEAAKQLVDSRDGLISVFGSTGLVSKYWQHRGIKKF